MRQLAQRTKHNHSVLTLSIGSGSGGWMTLKEEGEKKGKFVTMETARRQDTSEYLQQQMV